MLFNRREPPTWKERVRVLLWPRTSWERSLKYIALRLIRIPATPHQLALGCAIGVFAAITPLVGLQMVLAGVLAVMLKANFAAAMIGTLFGNPFVWAVVWPATYAAGALMLGLPTTLGNLNIGDELGRLGDALYQFSPNILEASFAVVWPVLKPMLVGTLPVGLFIAGLFYIVCKRAAEHQKQARLKGRSLSTANFPLGYLVSSYDPAQS